LYRLGLRSLKLKYSRVNLSMRSGWPGSLRRQEGRHGHFLVVQPLSQKPRIDILPGTEKCQRLGWVESERRSIFTTTDPALA
jgi:hypothetical protein